MRQLKHFLLGVVIFVAWLCFVLLLQSLGTVTEVPSSAAATGIVTSSATSVTA